MAQDMPAKDLRDPSILRPFLFIHRINSVVLTSSPALVIDSIRTCLAMNLPVGKSAGMSHQILITFRQGRSPVQPRKHLRENVILCVIYAPERARYCTLYRNDSTSGQWALGKYFADTPDPAGFEALPTEEQLIALGFQPA